MYENPRKVRLLSDVYRSDTLNIFSDASHKQYASAYSVIAVCKDDIINNATRMHKFTTSNAEELRGVRSALACALRFRHQYHYINIFSDSLLSIDSLRSYCNKWKYVEEKDEEYGFEHGRYYKAPKYTHRVENSYIFTECFEFLRKLNETNDVALFHQPGHVNLEGKGNTTNYYLKEAAKKFRKINNITEGMVDVNLMRYVSTYNDMVDRVSRIELSKCELKSNYERNKVPATRYTDAVTFIPTSQIEF